MGRADDLSPMGLFNWDNTVFDLMQIPAQLDRETLINNILAETMELEVLYTNPTVFKNLLGVWSAKQIDVWNRLYATTQYEYNPIENYNRYETGSDSGSGSTKHTGTDTTAETTAHGGADITTRENELGGSDRTTRENELGGSDSFETNTTHSGEDVDTGVRDSAHWIAGFNSVPSGDDDGLVKQSKDSESAENRHDYGHVIDETGETTYGKTESETGATTYGKTESETGSTTYGKTETKNGTMTHGETITTENDGEHELHAHGNIGVTTTQKLIHEQREVDKFNLYDIITDEFKMRFCILVY